eukprot:gene46736-57235_t
MISSSHQHFTPQLVDCVYNKEIVLPTANMGNASVGGAEAGALIGIELANGREPVCVGGLLQGKVYLQVNNEKVAAQSLALRLHGHEKTCVVHIAESGNGRSSRSYHYGGAALIKFEAIIAQFPTGELTQGRYEY